MKKEGNTRKELNLGYDPCFRTFPLANSENIVKDSNVSIPTEDDTKEVKDWVDFKEM